VKKPVSDWQRKFDDPVELPDGRKLRKHGCRKMTPRAWRSNMRCWSEPHRPPPCVLLIAALAVRWNLLGR